MPEKPILRPKPNQMPPEGNEAPALSSCANAIPLIFQAQIKELDRGNVQYVGDREDNAQPKYETWVKEWLAGCPPQPDKVDESIPVWKQKPIQTSVKLPQFGANVKTWEYQIRWRMVTNGGQDGDLIRPVIGAKGIPFFPGSSMKGAFRNACSKACSEEKCLRYCGGEIVNAEGEKRTKPGILRFHGGYPVGMDWAQAHRLVDIAHGQQPYQVMRSTKERGENANVQISLYQPKFKFGISCPEIPLNSLEWDEIKAIWEKALGYGIGSRVSAGYGYVQEVKPNSDHILLSVHLTGQGVSSQLLLKDPTKQDRFKTREFRPNMFKAVLRGHTLRLLGGLVDTSTAKSLTQIIWGGIPEKGESSKAVVGRIGIAFSVEGSLKDKDKHKYINERGKPVEMPVYKLEDGCLSLLRHREINSELEVFLQSLVKFSILFGGFGKSWRRADHRLFYQSYFEKNDKPMIGCHWDLTTTSQDFLVVPKQDLSGITNFIDEIRKQAIAWIQSELSSYQSGYAEDWREAWHSKKVQVWGRTTTQKSLAIHWFHGNYQGQKSIKHSELTGWSSLNHKQPKTKIGRTWHRMYPIENGFIELLTIFPDESSQTRDFLTFLDSKNSGFSKLWGDKLA
jgi:CRISPR-associated protein Cmr6